MYVEVNGTRLFVDMEGPGLVPDGGAMREKPTLVLLHGGPAADHSCFKPAFSALSDVAQVIYVDHRGCGRSADSDPATWHLNQWGDDVKALCDVSAFAVEHADQLAGIDINPFVVRTAGAVCLDALISLREAA